LSLLRPQTAAARSACAANQDWILVEAQQAVAKNNALANGNAAAFNG
jgi:hypothetical protein